MLMNQCYACGVYYENRLGHTCCSSEYTKLNEKRTPRAFIIQKPAYSDKITLGFCMMSDECED